MTKYDQMLCNYLYIRFMAIRLYGLVCFEDANLTSIKGEPMGKTLLDIGCGDGTHGECFNKLGIDARGIDKADCDLERYWIPETRQGYDFVFCKSVIEHIHNTEHLLSEAYRVLKPNGIAIFLTPDWHTDYKMFYDDPTHVKPFTRTGLIKAFKLAGFTDIECEQFYQLPYTWRHRWLRFLPRLISLLPDALKYNSKGVQRIWIRHSKERMLLLKARK